MRKINSQITGAYNEGIVGAKTSKTLVIEEANHKDFRNLTGDMYRSSIKVARLSATYIPLVLFLSSVATALVMWRGGHMVLED